MKSKMIKKKIEEILQVNVSDKDSRIDEKSLVKTQQNAGNFDKLGKVLKEKSCIFHLIKR